MIKTERNYYCPLCGKMYKTIDEMYECAKACEEKENRDTEQKEKDLKVINDKYDELLELVKKYNGKDYGEVITLNKIIKKTNLSSVDNGWCDDFLSDWCSFFNRKDKK